MKTELRKVAWTAGCLERPSVDLMVWYWAACSDSQSAVYSVIDWADSMADSKAAYSARHSADEMEATMAAYSAVRTAGGMVSLRVDCLERPSVDLMVWYWAACSDSQSAVYSVIDWADSTAV